MAKRGQGNLDAVWDLMRELRELAQSGAWHRTNMGRQAAPQVAHLFRDGHSGAAAVRTVTAGVALGLCEAWAISSQIVVNGQLPFCFCCFYPVLLAAFLAHHFTCLALFTPGCSSGKG